MDFDELVDACELSDMLKTARQITGDIGQADSCETFNDLQQNIESAYYKAMTLLADLQNARRIIARDSKNRPSRKEA